MKIGKHIIKTLRDNALESKIEREKKAFKDQMWSKVNGWLTNYDKDGDTDKIVA